MKDSADGIARLEAKLDAVIKLLALSSVAGKSLKESAVHLSKAGLAPKEIAALCDSTPNAVSVALSNAKKEGK